jgi:hypothetical protein
MSGQPCGYVYRDPTFFCARPEADHRDGRYGHPYTPLERRTGKDRRGEQVAAGWDFDLLMHDERAGFRETGTGPDLGPRATAPQASPADALREALQRIRDAAADQSEGIGLGQPRKAFATFVWNEARAALAAADSAPEPLTERRAWFVYEAARLAAVAARAPIIPESWVSREAAFRDQFLDVIERQCGPDRKTSPAELHQDWVEAYEAMGWTYGPTRDPVARTHPDMVPYDELGQLERDKDAVFVALCEIARQWVYDVDALTTEVAE